MAAATGGDGANEPHYKEISDPLGHRRRRCALRHSPDRRHLRMVHLQPAGGDGEGLLFKHGNIIKKVPQEELLGALKFELDNWK